MRYYKILDIKRRLDNSIRNDKRIGKIYTCEKLKVGADAIFFEVDSNKFFVSDRIEAILRESINEEIEIVTIYTTTYKYILEETFKASNTNTTNSRFFKGEKLIYVSEDLSSIELVKFISSDDEIQNNNYLVICKTDNCKFSSLYDKYRLFKLDEKDKVVDLIHKEITKKIFEINSRVIDKNYVLDKEINKTKLILNRNIARKVIFDNEKLDKDIYYNKKKINRLNNFKKKNEKIANNELKNNQSKLQYLLELVENI